jgi:hypothetical protein
VAARIGLQNARCSQWHVHRARGPQGPGRWQARAYHGPARIGLGGQDATGWLRHLGVAVAGSAVRGKPLSGLPVAARGVNSGYNSVDDILVELALYENDPLGFVLWAYPWGEKGTPLEAFEGPDDWQIELLEEMGALLVAGGDAGCLIQEAVRSGHGIGKSALVGMLVGWALCTMARTRGVVTAMTEPQLRTKTWSEMAKWHSMSLAQHLFEVQGRSIIAKGVDKSGQDLGRVWRVDAIPWSVHAPSSFAGLHNLGRRILLVYDEASEIHNEIWKVSRGALTDANTQIIWLVMGQPTQTSGEFFDCFSSKEWHARTIDSRESRFSNKKLIAQWAEEYGEDSDFFRVRVRGLPPRSGVSNFIPIDLVQRARTRELNRNMWVTMPKRMSIDPARFGDDLSVITIRQGQKVIHQWSYSGLDGPDLASRAVTEVWHTHRDISGCAVDAIGIGASCCDALRRVPGFPLLEVNVSIPAGDDGTYANMRAEIWGRTRKWLETAEIPDDQELEDQLCSVQYGFDGKSRIQLESKRDLKGRGYPSPDKADSLALTFYEEVVKQLSKKKAVALPSRTRQANIWSRRI